MHAKWQASGICVMHPHEIRRHDTPKLKRAPACCVCLHKIQRLHLWEAHNCGYWSSASSDYHKKAHRHCPCPSTDISLVYKKAKHKYLADTLLRAPSSHISKSPADEDAFEVMAVSYSTVRLEELRKHTAEDEVLQNLSAVIKIGCPTKMSQLHPAVRLFFTYRYELTVEDGIVMKGHKTIIRQSLYKVYINRMHKGHPGAEATKRRARNIIFWPTMTKDISEELLSCAACNSTKSHQQKESLQLHHVPDLPWSTVATDILKWRGKHYQVVVDSYSGWFKIDLLPNITTSAVISKLKRCFSVHGVPHTHLWQC